MRKECRKEEKKGELWVLSKEKEVEREDRKKERKREGERDREIDEV